MQPVLPLALPESIVGPRPQSNLQARPPPVSVVRLARVPAPVPATPGVLRYPTPTPAPRGGLSGVEAASFWRPSRPATAYGAPGDRTEFPIGRNDRVATLTAPVARPVRQKSAGCAVSGSRP